MDRKTRSALERALRLIDRKPSEPRTLVDDLITDIRNLLNEKEG